MNSDPKNSGYLPELNLDQLLKLYRLLGPALYTAFKAIYQRYLAGGATLYVMLPPSEASVQAEFQTLSENQQATGVSSVNQLVNFLSSEMVSGWTKESQVNRSALEMLGPHPEDRTREVLWEAPTVLRVVLHSIIPSGREGEHLVLFRLVRIVKQSSREVFGKHHEGPLVESWLVVPSRLNIHLPPMLDELSAIQVSLGLAIVEGSASSPHLDLLAARGEIRIEKHIAKGLALDFTFGPFLKVAVAVEGTQTDSPESRLLSSQSANQPMSLGGRPVPIPKYLYPTERVSELESRIASNPQQIDLRTELATHFRSMGNKERADLILLQLKLRELKGFTLEALDLARRCRELIGKNKSKRFWKPGDSTAQDWDYHLGCIEHVLLNRSSKADRLAKSYPITSIAFRDEEASACWTCLTGVHYPHLLALDLRNCSIDDEWVDRLVDQKWAKKLRWLGLNWNRSITPKGMLKLAQTLPRLIYVGLVGVPHDPTDDDDGDIPASGRELEQKAGRRIPWLHRDNWIDSSFPPTAFQLMDLLYRRSKAR